MNHLCFDTVVFKATCRSLWDHLFSVRLEFGSVGFGGGRKTGEPSEKSDIGFVF